jgi:hypothetical protein
LQSLSTISRFQLQQRPFLPLSSHANQRRK